MPTCYHGGSGANLITTNKRIKDRTELLARYGTLATAFPDRLLHHRHVLNTKGHSYRLPNLAKAVSLASR
jgi:DNA replication protein DnaC